ncbi:hypothetical protein [Sphingobium boeckii]|uniref:Uncharacterized protein n=1 Tax=Sphingobium boeckii TaxID=1082345 RepID=A0A7W9ED85_9SPHN|nr:hypothetical protein [Sphingobium boeckii]MBB5684694.1 hypothetical protein [Sphingobium boeckii]
MMRADVVVARFDRRMTVLHRMRHSEKPVRALAMSDYKNYLDNNDLPSPDAVFGKAARQT